MNIIVFLIVGIVVGWLAGIIVRGRGFGTLTDLVVGIFGALIGGYVFDIFNVPVYGFWEVFASSVVGSVILLLIVGLFTGLPKYKNRVL